MTRHGIPFFCNKCNGTVFEISRIIDTNTNEDSIVMTCINDRCRAQYEVYPRLKIEELNASIFKGYIIKDGD